MEFKTREGVYHFLKSCTYIDEGSQGRCYVDRERKLVYKVYFNFFDPIEEDKIFEKSEILRFKDAKSNFVMFPKDIITLNGLIIGDITKYVNATNLYKINPFRISLNRLIRLCELALKEIELLSKQNIKTDDMAHNLLLGRKLYLIDTFDYTWSEVSYAENLSCNEYQFNLSIMYFLISNLFEEIVATSDILREMYNTEGKGISITEFINELKNYLSKILGKEITRLGEARVLRNKKEYDTMYKRKVEF